MPLPIHGDQRRWDGLISGEGWRYGVEAETAPRDWQALSGRLELKRRDGGVDGVILVLPETRRTRAFLAAAVAFIPSVFPVPPRQLLARLAAGANPGGSGIIVLRASGGPQASVGVAGGIRTDDRRASPIMQRAPRSKPDV